MVIRSFKFRLLPTKRQHKILSEIVESQRQLYNAALQERIGAWQKAHKTIRYFEQSRSLTECRGALEEMRALPAAIQRETLKRLDRAMSAFFRRLSAGELPGFPRFKGRDRFDSFGFSEWKGVRLESGRLWFPVVGGVRIHLHRTTPNSAPIRAQVCRDSKGWFVCLEYRVEENPLTPTGCCVGLDVGIAQFAALSTGEVFPNPKAAHRAIKAIRRRQRALARCRLGSKRRKKVKRTLIREYAVIKNIRRTFHHQTAAGLVRRFDVIAIEQLNVLGLSRGFLAREVNDAAWGNFIQTLKDKAESAGRTVVSVDPSYTSQTCPDCGIVKPKTLSDRIHRCDCGCVLDRDVAAAKVILHRAVVGPGLAKSLDAAA